jgi:hypothetical protein
MTTITSQAEWDAWRAERMDQAQAIDTQWEAEKPARARARRLVVLAYLAVAFDTWFKDTVSYERRIGHMIRAPVGHGDLAELFLGGGPRAFLRDYPVEVAAARAAVADTTGQDWLYASFGGDARP